MRISPPQARRTAIGAPRSLVLSRAWAQLTGVGPFTGPTGLPLARTVKLLLDPLVIRPALRPHLSDALLSDTAAEELHAVLLAAQRDLAAAAAWYTVLKQARRRAGITLGNPQDLYFPRAYELARRHGLPGADASSTAAEVLAEIHSGSRPTVAELREHLTDPTVAERVQRAIADGWRRSDGAAGTIAHDALRRFLDSCADDGGVGPFSELLTARSGSAGAPDRDLIGAARALGLTTKDLPAPPTPGTTASKSSLPPPFDRSLLERLFASFGAVADSGLGLDQVVQAEVHRTAGAWELADESSRVLLLAAAEATSAFADGAVPQAPRPPSTDAARRLLGRWRREPFVHRALRLPAAPAETRGVREAVMRRLWARLHGRELRDEPLDGEDCWALLDGALRSVVLDRRSRVKASIARAALEEAA